MKLRLSDIYELQMGKTPARNTPAFWNGTNAWVSISDLTSSRKYISQTRECITDNAITRTGIKKIPKDTLLMSFKLSLGKVAITTTDIYTNEAIMAFIDKKKYDVDIHYMYHYFQAIDWTIGTNKAVKGITLNKRALSEKVVDLPPINIQQEIAERMDNLNAVTENLQRQFMLLDELVKSQFIEMFGDPVTNPMGWEVKKLSDIAEYYNGLTYRPEYTSDDGTLVLRSSNIQEGRLAFKDKVFVSCDIREKYFVQKNDILMCSRNGSARLVGKVAIIKDIDEPMAFGAFMMIIRSKLWAYLYVYFQMVAFRRQIITGKTSTINQITGKMLDAVELPVPTEDAVEKFMLFTQLVDKSKLVLRQLLEKQKTLKAALMQEYFS